VNTVARLCVDANCLLGDDVVRAFERAVATEASPTGRDILRQCLENQQIARTEMMPICQDTGWAVVWLEVGSALRISGGELYDAVAQGVAKGYREGYLRKSIVADPLRRKNTGDNTPPIIYTDIVPGDRLKVTVQPKGGGSENMSEVKMLSAADGEEGIKKFVVDRVARSRANPCPPVIVGVGIGGSFDKCAQLAKHALLREIGSVHPDPFYAAMESELLERINRLGIGPQGLGGSTTALAVFIEAFPCHIATMPCAVNINCHAARHKTAVLRGHQASDARNPGQPRKPPLGLLTPEGIPGAQRRMTKRITTPLIAATVQDLVAGDTVLITGTIYTGRDLAHRKLTDAIKASEPLPFDLAGAVIYYVGPSPAPPGKPIGSAGPTTSYRMDAYTPLLIERGMKGMIGKGNRSPAVLEAMKKHGAVYFAAVGGAAALIARSIKQAKVIAYPDLGPEAVHELVVEDFPAVVVNDVRGGDLYEQGTAQYRKDGGK